MGVYNYFKNDKLIILEDGCELSDFTSDYMRTTGAKDMKELYDILNKHAADHELVLCVDIHIEKIEELDELIKRIEAGCVGDFVVTKQDYDENYTSFMEFLDEFYEENYEDALYVPDRYGFDFVVRPYATYELRYIEESPLDYYYVRLGEDYHDFFGPF